MSGNIDRAVTLGEFVRERLCTWEVGFEVSGADDVTLYGWTIVPDFLKIKYAQSDDEPVAAVGVAVSGRERGKRGGLLKGTGRTADIGHYQLTRDRLDARMAELDVPEWMRRAVEDNWPAAI